MATPTPTPPGELSTRMATTVKTFLPLGDALLARRKHNPGDIDLSDGENSLMKTEMVEICKEAMNRSITADVSRPSQLFVVHLAEILAFPAFFFFLPKRHSQIP
jgi:hypothetical protein